MGGVWGLFGARGLCCCLRKWPTGGKGPGAVLQGDMEEVLFHRASGEGEPASR